ncbi:DUF6039 family protein [Streptomyces canus]|uniref:DUF6039 family protein n=1 Tax=Streptomyces canus TaxID=58343 RepID=UPI0033BF69EE
MTTTAEQPAAPTTPPHRAQDQTTLEPERLLHSGNAGMIIYRTGQLNYGYATEGRGFSVDLLRYLNSNQADVATTFCYEEVFGVRDRLHWLIHMRSPNEYQKLLHMVDHDEEFQGISVVDRLPEKGHGNWERIFADGSMRERILVPQHGLSHAHDEAHEPGEADNFVPSARHQTAQPFDIQLNSANAGAIILRTAHVKYEFREEGRLFAFDWQEHVNRELAGMATVLLYEETFGHQDRIYSLIHLRDLSDYQRLAELDRSAETQRLVYDKQRVHASKGGGTWDRVFVQDSIHDTLLLPQPPSKES